MKEIFESFCDLLLANQNQIETVVTKNDSNNIEFRMPIVTYGKLYGHNFYGIEKCGIYYEMYLITKSPFRKIKSRRPRVLKNKDFNYYEKILEELMQEQMKNPKYLKIATGRIF